MKKHSIVYVVVLFFTALLSIGLVGCGSTSPVTASQENTEQSKQQGYMEIDSTAVMFIQPVNTNNQLSGTIAETSFNTNGQISNYSGTIQGTLTNNQLSMTINFYGYGSSQVVGTFDTNQMTFSLPDTSNGGLKTYILTKASIQDYNNAVNNLKKTANQKAQQIANAQATAAAVAHYQQVVSNSNNQLSGDINTIQNDIQRLPGDTNTMNGDLKTYSSDIATTQSDYQTEQNDLSQGCSIVRGDLNVISGDLNVISGDDNVFSADQNTQLEIFKPSNQI